MRFKVGDRLTSLAYPDITVEITRVDDDCYGLTYPSGIGVSSPRSFVESLFNLDIARKLDLAFKRDLKSVLSEP